jgi:hypothetical protein
MEVKTTTCKTELMNILVKILYFLSTQGTYQHVDKMNLLLMKL